MIVNSARFVISNSDAAKCPADSRHEFAFIGRSNVGKSSLINMLTNRSGLAQTSATPGKTMLINHFLVNDQWYLVFIQWLGENGVPFCIVFTKLDKLSSTAAKKVTADYCATLLETWDELPPVFRTSAVDRRGRQELLDYIGQLSELPVGGCQEPE